ncbi:phosphomannomutase, partial [Salmonella enterica subsp. indica]|nr:phosphomannomutase [Salmonella enterica subsp. indica]
NDYVIKSLPTRDAVLPALMVLALAINRGISISGLLKNLSGRVTYSNRIQNFATERSKYILQIAQDDLQQFINQLGFGSSLCILSHNTIDGLRITLSDDSIFHLRPSGNAPELRCYAEADNLFKAEEIVDRVLHEIVLLGQ